jgi:hypothetical protein
MTASVLQKVEGYEIKQPLAKLSLPIVEFHYSPHFVRTCGFRFLYGILYYRLPHESRLKSDFMQIFFSAAEPAIPRGQQFGHMLSLKTGSI